MNPQCFLWVLSLGAGKTVGNFIAGKSTATTASKQVNQSYNTPAKTSQTTKTGYQLSAGKNLAAAQTLEAQLGFKGLQVDLITKSFNNGTLYALVTKNKNDCERQAGESCFKVTYPTNSIM